MEYNTDPYIEEELLSYFKKRLNISDEEYEHVIQSKPKSWTDYPTYKKLFEYMRPIFLFCVKTNLVPDFYIKYCLPRKSAR